jgi:hypothetical protein
MPPTTSFLAPRSSASGRPSRTEIPSQYAYFSAYFVLQHRRRTLWQSIPCLCHALEHCLQHSTNLKRVVKAVTRNGRANNRYHSYLLILHSDNLTSHRGLSDDVHVCYMSGYWPIVQFDVPLSNYFKRALRHLPPSQDYPQVHHLPPPDPPLRLDTGDVGDMSVLRTCEIGDTGAEDAFG